MSHTREQMQQACNDALETLREKLEGFPQDHDHALFTLSANEGDLVMACQCISMEELLMVLDMARFEIYTRIGEELKSGSVH